MYVYFKNRIATPGKKFQPPPWKNPGYAPAALNPSLQRPCFSWNQFPLREEAGEPTSQVLKRSIEFGVAMDLVKVH